MSDLQKQFNNAFGNYLDMSDILREDISMLLDIDDDSVAWRRNFIRASFPLIEGFCHCYREMCTVALHTDALSLTENEEKVIKDERSFSFSDRYKYTLRAAYKLFEIQPLPDFGLEWWPKAQSAMNRRDRIMHPKTLEDLHMSESEWSEIHEGLRKTVSELFKFPEHVLRKHYQSSS